MTAIRTIDLNVEIVTATVMARVIEIVIEKDETEAVTATTARIARMI